MVSPTDNNAKGGWLSHQASMALPHVRREFDMNRDPHVAAQLRDMEMTEAQRRRALDPKQASQLKSQQEQSGGESSSGGRSHSPSQSMGLAAQRDAAFKSHAQFKQSQPANEQNNVPHHKPRNAPRYSGPSM